MTAIKYPKIKYIPKIVTVDATNNKIDFEETVATPLVATVASGTYTIGALRTAVQTALNAAGASLYTVTYSPVTQAFTLTSDGAGGGGIFSIFWDTGANSANSIGPLLGYDVTDDTGALFYASDQIAPQVQEFIFTEPIRTPRYAKRPRQNVTQAVSGSNESIFLRTDETFDFRMRFIAQADMSDWHDFWDSCFLEGSQFDFFPDNTVAGNHIALIRSGSNQGIVEMNSVGLFGYYEFTINTRIVSTGINTPEGSNTIDFETLTDRGSLGS